MIIYIAGKIQGDPEYKRKFAKAAEWVRSLGDTALNPARHPAGLTKADYMRMNFAMIDTADMVYFLPDWQDSEGARLERAYCDYVGKGYITIEEGEI